MAIVTATQVTIYSNISCSAATITSSGLIPMVQARIVAITNNNFLSDISIQGPCTFSTSTLTVIGSNLPGAGFASGDEIYVYGSYRNDGYKTVSGISTSAFNVTTDTTDELSGASVLISLVQWPLLAQDIASQFVAYDYDVRPTRSAGVKSRSLGPWSESYSESIGQFGYPQDLIDKLIPLMRTNFI